MVSATSIRKGTRLSLELFYYKKFLCISKKPISKPEGRKSRFVQSTR